ncbi:MAG: type II toxin-antitoxin system HicA family toxin [Xenococcaceae cyanobacterium MO_188.B19]|nr:type II toxin-antitoxin system HicA family toxin [Xenococcaceae cyanobacterium MO_188.B19]
MKIRKLKSYLSKSGFQQLNNRGKGSHFIYEHPITNIRFYGSGKDNKEAKPYQIKAYERAIAQVSVNA